MSTDDVHLHVNAVGAVMGGAARHLSEFLAALHDVRPTWEVTAWVSEGRASAVPDVPQLVLRSVPRRGVAHRLVWENVALPVEVRRSGASALLNLTNSCPLWAPAPSVLYQRNALWFDRSWLAHADGRSRRSAWVRRRLALLQMRRAVSTIVPSAAMAEMVLAAGSPTATSLHVVPHGVSTTFAATDRSWPPPSTRPLRLLSVGHAAPHKDQRLVVHLTSRLLRDGIDVESWLTVDHRDDPAYVVELEAEADRLGVTDRVHLLGRVDDVERLYRDADVSVLPSRCESFGFPVVESMAAGIPVLASRIGATEELLGDEGWYFEPGDTEGAARALRELLRTPAELMERATKLGRARAGALTWAANAERVARVVEAALRPPG